MVKNGPEVYSCLTKFSELPITAKCRNEGDEETNKNRRNNTSKG
jgi:hypothetical protein